MEIITLVKLTPHNHMNWCVNPAKRGGGVAPAGFVMVLPVRQPPLPNPLRRRLVLRSVFVIPDFKR